MKKRNRIVMGIGIPLSLIITGVGVLAFYISLVLAIGISINNQSAIIDELLLYSSFFFIGAGIIAFVGSILSGFKSLPGGIVLLAAAFLALINPIFMIVCTALYSESFSFAIVLFLLPSIVLLPLGIWAICTKAKKVAPKTTIQNNNNVNNLTIAQPEQIEVTENKEETSENNQN